MKRFLTVLLAAAATAVAAADKADPKPDVPTVVNGNNAFALDLYGQLRSQDGNVFFSPYSISTALAMTRAGAKGETASQMDKTLHFTLDQDKLNPAFAALIQQVNGDPADPKRGYQ
ncbi:MAG TPA: serpin family protein, partial [Gemmataceae bacterium]|nr:serpin family protein [Gemmataceae bacterium]